jgi:hypothetical protein
LQVPAVQVPAVLKVLSVFAPEQYAAVGVLHASPAHGSMRHLPPEQP